jgi:hypothetical protein
MAILAAHATTVLTAPLALKAVRALPFCLQAFMPGDFCFAGFGLSGHFSNSRLAFDDNV